MAIYYDDGSTSDSGRVVQVVTQTKGGVSSTNSQSFVDIAGLSLSITPKSSSNKILILYNVGLNGSDGAHNSLRLLRGSTGLSWGDSYYNQTVCTGHIQCSGSQHYTISTIAGQFLDSPNTTSSTTYKFQMGNPWTTSYSTNINMVQLNQNGAYNGRTMSVITLMEIAA